MDIALKQRLVGASVLIALAVIVLPMLLGGRPEEGAAEPHKIELPRKPDELDFQTRRYPLGEATPSRAPDTRVPDLPAPGQPAEPAPSETAGEAGPGTVAHVELEPREVADALLTPEPDRGEETAAADDAGGAPVPEAPEQPAAAAEYLDEPTQSDAGAAPAAGGRYIVQVASFGSVDNARRLAEMLRGYGYGVLSDTVTSDVGTLHRVRVGPFGTESEANAVVGNLRNQISDVRPRVMDLQPERAAQVTTPSDPLVRWVVQAGSFSSADNADKLVEQLRGLGLSAYKETVTSAGSTVFRVRAGPYVEREEAIRVNGLVSERLSLQGVVMSAD